jgi:hypothetical protein
MQEFIEKHTTVSTERTIVRLLGIDGVDDVDTPLPNVVIDHLKDAGALPTGAAYFIGNAIVQTGKTPQEIAEDVAAGKKANTSIVFTSTGWEELDALPIAHMEFAFCIFDTESWDTYLDSDIITIETSAAGTVDYVMDDSGTVFYDADGIKIVAKGLSENDSIWGPGLILYIENNTDQNFTVQARDTSVNGFMMDGSLSQNVASGKKAITSLTFFETDMESNGVTEISEIETAFVAFDSESWEDLAYTDAMVLNF